MLIRTTRSNLLGGLNAVKDVVKGEDELNPFRFMKIETMGDNCILVAGSDGDVQVTSRIFCDIDEQGSTLLVGSRLVKFVGALPDGEVDILVDKQPRAKIEGGCTTYSLAKGEVGDYPMMKGPVDGEGFVSYYLPASTLKELLRKVKYAAGTGKVSAAICGVNFRTDPEKPEGDSLTGVDRHAATLHVAAADGRRLSCVALRVDAEKSDMTVPNKAVEILYKLLSKWHDGDVLVATDGKSARFTAELWSVTTKICEQKYPDYAKVIPAETAKSAEITCDSFLAELKRATVACDADGYLKMAFTNGKATFTAKTQFSSSESSTEIKYIGEKVVFKVDPEIMKQLLEAMDGDVAATIRFNEAEKAFVLERSDIRFLAVVMPMRKDD